MAFSIYAVVQLSPNPLENFLNHSTKHPYPLRATPLPSCPRPLAGEHPSTSVSKNLPILFISYK